MSDLSPIHSPSSSGDNNQGLRSVFNKVKEYARNNSGQTASILSAVLLGTTALTAPLLGTTLTAGALMLGSCYLLTKCSDALIDNVAAIGNKMKLSPLFIGLGLGVMTSMPELFVSLGSIMRGVPEIGIGNIVGSNIANILLILGVTASICEIGKGKGLEWKFNNAVMLGTTGLFGAQLLMGTLNPLLGGTMLALGAAYMASSYFISKKDSGPAIENAADTAPPVETLPATGTEEKADSMAPENMPTWFNGVWGLAGLTGLILSADMLINSSSAFALGLGVSQALIGTLAVAVGTSLPELVVNVKTALKGETDMALGNILGSNIFNILMVGGAVALTGTVVPPEFGPYSAPGLLNFGAFLASGGLLAATLHKNEGGIKKWQGAAALALYAAFVAGSMALDNNAAPAPAALPAPAAVTAPALPAP